MITKRNTVICDGCGLFCRIFDEYTPFGCSSYDPPEPLDPSHICKKCFNKEKERWISLLKKNKKVGDWQKSRAEHEAASELELVWIGSGGYGMLGTKDFAEPYQYITKKEYERLKAFPYYGYCKICGAERKNGYCGKNECSESFNSKLTPYQNQKPKK